MRPSQLLGGDLCRTEFMVHLFGTIQACKSSPLLEKLLHRCPLLPPPRSFPLLFAVLTGGGASMLYRTNRKRILRCSFMTFSNHSRSCSPPSSPTRCCRVCWFFWLCSVGGERKKAASRPAVNGRKRPAPKKGKSITRHHARKS